MVLLARLSLHPCEYILAVSFPQTLSKQLFPVETIHSVRCACVPNTIKFSLRQTERSHTWKRGRSNPFFDIFPTMAGAKSIFWPLATSAAASWLVRAGNLYHQIF